MKLFNRIVRKRTHGSIAAIQVHPEVHSGRVLFANGVNPVLKESDPDFILFKIK
jgi:hypothetical protein